MGHHGRPGSRGASGASSRFKGDVAMWCGNRCFTSQCQKSPVKKRIHFSWLCSFHFDLPVSYLLRVKGGCLRRSWELPRFHLLKRNNLLEPMPKRNPPNSELAVTNGCVQKAPKPPGSIRREPRLQTEGPWAPRWSGYEAHLLEAAWWWWWIWVCIIYYNNIWHIIYIYIIWIRVRSCFAGSRSGVAKSSNVSCLRSEQHGCAWLGVAVSWLPFAEVLDI